MKSIFFIAFILIAFVVVTILDIKDDGGTFTKRMLFKLVIALFVGLIMFIGKKFDEKFHPFRNEEKEITERYRHRDNPFVQNQFTRTETSGESCLVNEPGGLEKKKEAQIDPLEAKSDENEKAIHMCREILIFDRSKVPASKSEFMSWYEAQVDWDENLNYNDVSNATPALKAWFMEAIKTYPPMNGKFSPSLEALEEDETLEDRMTEYSIGENFIYAAFSGSVCEEAYALSLSLAKKYDLGFFESGIDDGDVILPDGSFIVDE